VAREQIGITLDDYHKWAVERIADAMHKDRTELIAQSVQEWIAKYPEVAASAKATLADFASTEEGKSTKWQTRKRKSGEE
jgi:predicted transcriptional regulator